MSAVRFAFWTITLLAAHLLLPPSGAQAGPMVFQAQDMEDNDFCTGCFSVIASGEITPETPKQFEAILAAAGTAQEGAFSMRTVVLDSPGGDLQGGLELGRLFRKYKISVHTGFPRSENDSSRMKCLSACAYAFLGSNIRGPMSLGILAMSVQTNDSLGFHQFFDSNILNAADTAAFTGVDRLQDQIVAGILVEYLIEMGIHTDLYTKASQTPPDQMYFPTLAEAERFGIVEGDLPVAQQETLKHEGTAKPWDWQILPYGKGLRLELAFGQRAQRIFCMQKNPETIHIQVLHRTKDGSTTVSGDYGSVDIREHLYLLDNAVLSSAGEYDEDMRSFPARFGGLFADPENQYSFLIDIELAAADFRQVNKDDFFSFGPTNFTDMDIDAPALQSLGPGGGITFVETISGGFPPGTDPNLFALMEANCI